jgi:hypothetical protein
MKKTFLMILVSIVLLVSVSVSAQLLPSIGLNAEPADNNPICAEPIFNGSFSQSGFQKNDFVPDFKLYDLNGDSLVLSQKLQSGRPVLLISSSLSCPVFRNKVPVINQVASVYAGLIDVYVIYTIEAHPTDTSVYFGYINITSPNQTQGILFASPQNYGARKAMVDTMSSFVNLNVPVYIDGPCNEWLNNFGPAPNNSYLIDTNGKVLSKHAWFDKSPDDIFCDLDSLLNFNSSNCSVINNGTFGINVLNMSANGSPGRILYNYIDIFNNSSSDVSILIKSLQKNLPADWETAYCADICYSPGTDSIIVNINAGDTMHFSLDFITGLTADSGSLRLGLRNNQDFNNQFSVWLSASTFNSTATYISSKEDFTLFPNPFIDFIFIQTESNLSNSIQIFNTDGILIYRSNEKSISNQIDLSSLSPGIYVLKTGNFTKKIVKI